ncbi:MAG TPA: hypothetical protein VLA45_09905 [Paracoccaceae bacterium]|nr:hypothetical protein [Paracoccaceae bacterium]
MKTIIALAGAFALAACSGGEAADTTDDTTAAAAPSADSPLIGVYGGTDMEGGTWTSAMNGDGTYEDRQGGEVTETGTWTHEGDQVCFVPADGAAADLTCLTLINVNDDGSLLMSDADGNETTVPRLQQ